MGGLTFSLDDDSFAEATVQDSDEFRSSLRMMAQRLSQEKDSFMVEDSYQVQTSQGEDLEVVSFYTDTKVGRSYFLVMVGSEGKIVACKYFQCREVEEVGGEPRIKIIGRTDTGMEYSSRGYASGIEKVYVHVLQEEATRLGYPINWHVHDVNLRSLQQIEALLLDGLIDEETAAIQRRERSRWERLYGAGGKLGLDANGNRTFLPGGIIEQDLRDPVTRSGTRKTIDDIRLLIAGSI